MRQFIIVAGYETMSSVEGRIASAQPRIVNVEIAAVRAGLRGTLLVAGTIVDGVL